MALYVNLCSPTQAIHSNECITESKTCSIQGCNKRGMQNHRHNKTIKFQVQQKGQNQGLCIHGVHQELICISIKANITDKAFSYASHALQHSLLDDLIYMHVALFVLYTVRKQHGLSHIHAYSYYDSRGTRHSMHGFIVCWISVHAMYLQTNTDFFLHTITYYIMQYM